ncbi:hypothetical protein Gasu2_13190 [Galdieria sulphuraria]|nr:hypothetical protein Gasu2_13190 [Galdieria sulphuraria]
MASPAKKKKSPYQVVTPEDIRLLKRLNSNIRVRDECNMIPTPARISIPLPSSKHENTVSYSEMYSHYPLKYCTRLERNTSELENSRNTDNITRKINDIWEYPSVFLKRQSQYERKKQPIFSKVARKLTFEIRTRPKWISPTFKTIVAILRILMLFILFCLILSSTSYSFADIHSDCGKLTSGREHFCHPNINVTSIYQTTCKEGLIMIGSIECIPDNSSNRMLVELYNITLHILKTRWDSQCSFKEGFHDFGMTVEQLQQAILSSHQNANDMSEILKKLPFYLSKTSGIVWKTTSHQPIQYYYVLNWNLF